MTTPPDDPFERKEGQPLPEPPVAPEAPVYGAPAAAPPPPQQPGATTYNYGPGGQQQYPPQGQPQYAQQQYAQQQYAQPGQPQYPQGYAAPPYGNQANQEKNWMNILSLVMSLAGLITGITVIVGIIFGHLGLSAAKRGEANNRGLGVAGLIVGYVLLGLFILGIILLVWFIGLVATECGGSNPADWCTEDGTYEWEWEALGTPVKPLA